MKSLGYRILALATILFWLTVLITFPIAKRIEKSVDAESKAITLLISSIITNAPDLDRAYTEIKEIVSDLNFPVVITNEMGLPVAWAGIDVPKSRFDLKTLYRPDLLKDDPDYLRLIAWMGKLGEKHDPYEIKKGEEVFGYIYYGYPGYTGFLRLVPVIILGLSIIAFIILLEAGRVVHTYEIEALWASFARGLAHQMGTPVSALLGWIDLLKQGNCSEEILEAMERDVKRLVSILQRFSRVGGDVKKERLNLAELLSNLIEELKLRFLKGVEVRVKVSENIYITGDRELLSWAFENLIKNSYEALSAGGFIEIEAVEEDHWVKVFVKDNGKGIPPRVKRKLFRESVTTKERGWGIGLLLSRRIIEEFHGGKLRLIKSEPFVETVFCAEFIKEVS